MQIHHSVDLSRLGRDDRDINSVTFLLARAFQSFCFGKMVIPSELEHNHCGERHGGPR